MLADGLKASAGLVGGNFIAGKIGKLSARGASNAAAEGGSNLLKPLGLGSTGRAAAGNLNEQLALEEVMSNPTMGDIVMTGMKDTRWLGWNKMQYVKVLTDPNKTKIVIHYVAKYTNGIMTAIDDFKFK